MQDIENAKRQEAADKKRKEDAEKHRSSYTERDQASGSQETLGFDESMGSLLNKNTKILADLRKRCTTGNGKCPVTCRRHLG